MLVGRSAEISQGWLRVTLDADSWGGGGRRREGVGVGFMPTQKNMKKA